MRQTPQSIREGGLISLLSDGSKITPKQVVQLRLQRLQDVLNYGKTTINGVTHAPRKNPIKRIISHLIY